MSNQTKKATAFIFARGGSKGLPGKNIKKFCGKPLIVWAIEHAKGSSYIDRIIVSTDSKEIAKIAEKNGAEVPFIRPKYLSKDTAPERKAWQHALEFLKKTENKLPEIMISVPCTSPLRTSKDLDNAIKRFMRGDVDTVLTVTEAARNPYYTMLKKSEKNLFELAFKSDKHIIRRQDAPKIYDIAGIAFVSDPKFVLSCDNLYEGKVGAIEIPLNRSIDIDTNFDFEIAETLMKKNTFNIK